MNKNYRISHQQSGMALGLALVAIFIATVAGAVFLSKASNKSAVAYEDHKKRELTMQAQENLSRIKDVLSVAFSRIANNPQTANYNFNPTGPSTIVTSMGQSITLVQSLRLDAPQDRFWRALLGDRTTLESYMTPATESVLSELLETVPQYNLATYTNRERFSLTCERGCNASVFDSPKIFDITYELRSEDGSSVVVISTGIQLSAPFVNDVAMLIARQPANLPFTFISTQNVDGKFMLFHENPDAEVRFFNINPLNFAREVVTDVSESNFIYGRTALNGYADNNTAVPNAPVNFNEGVIFDASGSSVVSGIQSTFAGLATAAGTHRVSDSFGVPGPTVLEFSPRIGGGCNYRIYKESSTALITDVNYASNFGTPDYSNVSIVSADARTLNISPGLTVGGDPGTIGGSFGGDLGDGMVPSLTPNSVGNQKRIQEQEIRPQFLSPRLPLLSIWGLMSLATETSTPAGGAGTSQQQPDGTFHTPLSTGDLPSSVREKVISISSGLVEIRAAGNQNSIAPCMANLTIIAPNEVRLAASIMKPQSMSATRGNVAIVSLNGNVSIPPTARSLVNGRTLESISQTGGVAASQKSFHVDSTLIALNGSFRPAYSLVNCRNDGSCPQTLGKAEFNGSMMLGTFQPWTQVSGSNVVAGWNNVDIKFNPGLLQADDSGPGAPPGLLMARNTDRFNSSFTENRSVVYRSIQSAVGHFTNENENGDFGDSADISGANPASN